MTATIYPVAATAEAALHAPCGFAARASQAQAIAAASVMFVAEPAGPAFASREAAQAAYGSGDAGAGLAQGWARLVPVTPETSPAPTAPARPVYSQGRRWAAPSPGPAATHWRLWVSYWRMAATDADAQAAPTQAARRLRRSVDGRALGAEDLSALARQPLRPVRPQQPLEIGLFEARRPEAPDLIIPDE